jgi:acetoin utilization protein AcuB
MLMPPISRYITLQPWTIGPQAKMSQARAEMREHGIRHLPVLEGDRVVGIVSERDLALVENLTRDPSTTVADAMVTEVYAAQESEPVDVVVERMARHKYGSVVVLDRGGRVAGIFTTVDGMQVLADVLRRATA